MIQTTSDHNLKNIQLFSIIPSFIINLIISIVFLLTPQIRSLSFKLVFLVALSELVLSFQYIFLIIQYPDFPHNQNMCQLQALFAVFGQQSRSTFIFLITLNLYCSAILNYNQHKLNQINKIYMIVCTTINLVSSLIPYFMHYLGFNQIMRQCSVDSKSSVSTGIKGFFLYYLEQDVLLIVNILMIYKILRNLQKSNLDQITKKYIYKIIVFPIYQIMIQILLIIIVVYSVLQQKPESNMFVTVYLYIYYLLQNLQGFFCGLIYGINQQVKTVLSEWFRCCCGQNNIRVSSIRSSYQSNQDCYSLQPQMFLEDSINQSVRNNSKFMSRCDNNPEYVVDSLIGDNNQPSIKQMFTYGSDYDEILRSRNVSYLK